MNSIIVFLIQERESVSALTSLMQEPSSPEVKPGPEDSKDYTQLTGYSIVIDIKSTVWAQRGFYISSAA